jgi:hypothetical protein
VGRVPRALWGTAIAGLPVAWALVAYASGVRTYDTPAVRALGWALGIGVVVVTLWFAWSQLGYSQFDCVN